MNTLNSPMILSINGSAFQTPRKEETPRIYSKMHEPLEKQRVINFGVINANLSRMQKLTDTELEEKIIPLMLTESLVEIR